MIISPVFSQASNTAYCNCIPVLLWQLWSLFQWSESIREENYTKKILKQTAKNTTPTLPHPPQKIKQPQNQTPFIGFRKRHWFRPNLIRNGLPKLVRVWNSQISWQVPGKRPGLPHVVCSRTSEKGKFSW